MSTKISNVNGVLDITAFMTTDGSKYFELSKAERRQNILNRNDRPCNECDCSGEIFMPTGGIGTYKIQCEKCNGHGFLKLDFIKLPNKNPK